MFDERSSLPGSNREVLVTGKLYKLKQKCRFKSINNDKNYVDSNDTINFVVNNLRELEPGHILMYIGETPDEWRVLREAFLSQNGEVIAPQIPFGSRLSFFLESQIIPAQK